MSSRSLGNVTNCTAAANIMTSSSSKCAWFFVASINSQTTITKSITQTRLTHAATVAAASSSSSTLRIFRPNPADPPSLQQTLTNLNTRATFCQSDHKFHYSSTAAVPTTNLHVSKQYCRSTHVSESCHQSRNISRYNKPSTLEKQNIYHNAVKPPHRFFSTRIQSFTPAIQSITSFNHSPNTNFFKPNHLPKTLNNTAPPRRFQSKYSNDLNEVDKDWMYPSHQSDQNKSNESSRTKSWGLVFFLGLACVSISLGFWQLYRRQWKINLIETITKQIHSKPIMLNFFDTINTSNSTDDTVDSATPDNVINEKIILSSKQRKTFTSRSDQTVLSYHSLPEFLPMRITGQIDYSKQMLVGFRTPPTSLGNAQPGSSTQPQLEGVGCYLINPFIFYNTIAKEYQTVLVNRGWVPKGTENDLHLETIDPLDNVTLIGISRRGEEQNRYIKQENRQDSNFFSSLDIATVADKLELHSKDGTDLPLILDIIMPKQIAALTTANVDDDAKQVSSLEHHQQPKQLIVRKIADKYTEFYTTPQVHITYAWTWFSLGFAVIIGTAIRFKKIPTPITSAVDSLQQQIRKMMLRTTTTTKSNNSTTGTVATASVTKFNKR